MGKRLSKIYTRTGDDGTTGITGGDRVPKDDARMEAIGDVDELNSTIGLVRIHPLPEAVAGLLERVQQDLFNLGGELSMPGVDLVPGAAVDRLEEALDALNETLPPLDDFILPGGTPAAAATHLARTVCRRAERRLVTLGREAEVSEVARRYLNRLSDYLFVCARVLNAEQAHEEVQWDHEK